MATKIIDGLFLGDLESAHDVDFLVSNKVTHIINCCGRGGNSNNSGRRSRNGGPRNAASGGGYGYNNKPWERIGIKYLVYNWQSSTTFDGSEDNVEMFSSFIDAALGECTSVLIHSRDGASRACAVVAAYLMKRLLWGVEQMLEYLRVKRHDLNPTLPVRRQLFEIQRRMEEQYRDDNRIMRRLTTPNWTNLDNGLELHFQGELPLEIDTIVNTHVNSLQPREVPRPRGGERRIRLTWIDLQQQGNGNNGGQSSSSTGRGRRSGNGRDPRGKGTPVRPPGTSYNESKPGNGWMDTMVQSGGQRNPYVRYDDGGGSGGSGGSGGRGNGNGGQARQPTKYPMCNGLSNGGGATTLRACLKSAATRDHDRVGAAAALAEAAALAAETASKVTPKKIRAPINETTPSNKTESLLLEEGSTSSPARWRTDMVKVSPGDGNGESSNTIQEGTMTNLETTPLVKVDLEETTKVVSGNATTQWGVASSVQDTIEIQPKKLPVSAVEKKKVKIGTKSYFSVD